MLTRKVKSTMKRSLGIHWKQKKVAFISNHAPVLGPGLQRLQLI